eukprot:366139-Chlamydomonas_euryale.AAC.9
MLLGEEGGSCKGWGEGGLWQQMRRMWTWHGGQEEEPQELSQPCGWVEAAMPNAASAAGGSHHHAWRALWLLTGSNKLLLISNRNKSKLSIVLEEGRSGGTDVSQRHEAGNVVCVCVIRLFKFTSNMLVSGNPGFKIYAANFII